MVYIVSPEKGGLRFELGCKKNWPAMPKRSIGLAGMEAGKAMVEHRCRIIAYPNKMQGKP